jgi:phosphopantothenoylcysteine decarboxylase/phosphopantothenate--cysteine ligase
MRVLLGVCGGVAAYKSVELLRILQRRGVDVQVVMTDGAQRFVTPLTFAALSGKQVLTSLWTPTVSETTEGMAAGFDIEHIRVAQEVDAVVIAPATANALAKLAHGIADDLLSTICLATSAPLIVAPAMNVVMWQHAATRENIAMLRNRSVHIVEPGAGELACGMVGEGRLAEPETIADAVCNVLEKTSRRKDDLTGETVLITAGGTREPIDPVRFVGNRSSGKMGHALAEAALARGAKVVLVTAATGDVMSRCEVVRVNTAAEMQRAVLKHLPGATIVVMAAAVSDYRVKEVAPQKLKKQNSMTLELERNDDILQRVVAERRSETVVIGFAAETEHVLEEGRRKLREKGVDAIVANDVSTAESGFEVNRNAGVLLTRNAEIALPMSSKREMAERIFDSLEQIRSAMAAERLMRA